MSRKEEMEEMMQDEDVEDDDDDLEAAKGIVQYLSTLQRGFRKLEWKNPHQETNIARPHSGRDFNSFL